MSYLFLSLVLQYVVPYRTYSKSPKAFKVPPSVLKEKSEGQGGARRSYRYDNTYGAPLARTTASIMAVLQVDPLISGLCTYHVSSWEFKWQI